MAYPLEDDPLQCLENIENNEDFTFTAPLRSLKVELRFLKTFFWCMANRSADRNPKSKRFLSVIEGVIVEARNHLHSQYCNSTNAYLEDEADSCCNDILEKINKYKTGVRDFYTSIPPYRSRTNTTSIGDETSADIIQSLIDNMSDLLHHKTNLIASVKEKIKSLEEKLRYLRSFVKFTKASCVEQDKMEDLLTHIHDAVADKAAYLSYQCWVYTIDANGAHGMNLKLTGLLENIKPHKPEVTGIYTGVLKALMASRSSSSMMQDEFVAGFVNFLLEDLIELTNLKKNNLVKENKKKEKGKMKNSSMAPMKDQIDSLHKELRFLIAFFIDPPKQYAQTFTLTRLLVRIEAMIKEAGSTIFHARELHFTLPYLLEKMGKASTEIREVFITFPRSSYTNFPKTDELGFIDSLLHHLKELVYYKIVSDGSLKDQIKIIQQDLVFLRDLLHDSAEQCDELTNLRRNTMQEAYRVEYTLHSLLVGDHTLWSHILDDLIYEIRLIKRKANHIMSHKKTTNIGHPPVARAPSRQNSEASTPKIQDVVVGLEGEVKDLVIRLTSKGQQDVDHVVSIVGMPGLGKTTLAKKVYNNNRITKHFDVQAWCCISQQYDKGEVLLELLSQVSEQDNHFKNMSSGDLAHKLRQSLLGKRYLIVMDDVWNIQAWEDISKSFPDENNGSKILLTSRVKAIASEIKPGSTPHCPRFLSKDKCWELLQKKIFGNGICPPELHQIGGKIAEKCEGLPLYVVLVAGLLLRTDKTKECWNQVLEKLNLTVSGEAKECTDVLELSYQHLPDHLKCCFLYLGAFPEDKEIPVSKLTRLWIAEGFVKESKTRSMEEVGEDYLMDLIDRSLVLVAKIRSQGGVKACRVHDLLRDFCLMKAKQENFLHWVDGDSSLPPYPEDHGIDPHHSPSSCSPVYEHHRLCIYSKRNQLLSARPSGPCARTLLIFARPDWNPQLEYNVSTIFHGFKLLKVLDLGCINMGQSFPSQIELLVQLRYLAVWGSMKEVPSSIENLWNLQTFLVKGTMKRVAMPMNLWDMPKLKHVHVPPFCLHKYDQDFLDNNVETLSTLSLRGGKETENLMRIFHRLRKLTCRFSRSRGGTNQFPALDFLERLEALKVIYDGSGRNRCDLHFPLNLKKLTLSKFGLPWAKISAIQRLWGLEVLKLLNGAFAGEEWDMTSEDEDENCKSFPNLRFLKLDSLDLVRWNAEGHSFPRLQHLVLRNCKKLQEIPSGLADNNTLQTIEVGRCTVEAASSAKQIQEEQKGLGNEKVEVLIYPRQHNI